MSLSPPNLSWLRVSPEDRLLLAIARTDLRDENSEEINRAIASGVDWDTVIESSRSQRLSGFLYRHLAERYLGDKIPTSVKSRMKDDHLLVLTKGVYFDREIKAILECLRVENISVILLKGAALRGTVFQDPNVRPMSDIDILVAESQAQRVQGFMVELGYTPIGGPEEQAVADSIGRHLPRLQGVGKPTAIEVHRHIVSLDSPLHFDISGFWERAIRFELRGQQARMLSPEDQLIHLSIGFMTDRQFKSASALGQLADINAVIEQSDHGVDWDLLLRLLAEYGLLAPVGCAITLSRLLLGTSIPSETASSLWPDGTTEDELALFVESRVLTSGRFVAKNLVSPGSSYTILGLVRSVGRRLMPEREYMVRKYGNSARGAWGLRFYMFRFVEALRIIGGGMRRPGELRDDFMVDRWMHSLFDKS